MSQVVVGAVTCLSPCNGAGRTADPSDSLGDDSRRESLIGTTEVVRENPAVPKGTRVLFPLNPALRLRLRAGLRYALPSALGFREAYATAALAT